MIDIVESILPAFVQRLYASGVERELLERSLNGMASTCSELAVVALTIFVFSKRICALLSRAEEPKFFMAVLMALSVLKDSVDCDLPLAADGLAAYLSGA